MCQQHADRSILYGLTSTCKYAPISWGEVYMYANPSSGACVYRGKYGPVTHQKQPPFLVEQWASGRKSPREGRADRLAQGRLGSAGRAALTERGVML